PLGEAVSSTNETQKIARVLVYAGADADFTLYSDDGRTYAYEHGDASVTRLHWDDSAHRLTGSDTGLTEVIGK
ncbi:MAG: DUF5110 domain-containing protein, partial [Bryobacteraceae bacterium]